MTPAHPVHRDGSCQCGGRCGRGHTASIERLLDKTWSPAAADQPPAHACGCSPAVCPRRYHALAGLILGIMLMAHLATSALGWWPAQFQAAVNRIHRLGVALPWIEMTLIGLPLAVHVSMGLKSLRKSGLKPGVRKHHHGSDLRYWLQRVSAVVLLAFLAFHVLTLHRWAGGQFDPSDAFASTRLALRSFWNGESAGSPGNLLLAQFYLLGIVAAVYHLANGVSTSADVFDLTPTPAARRRFWNFCIVGGAALGSLGVLAWSAFVVR